MSFLDEIQKYTDEELELIISTQVDLYSNDEMSELKKLLEARIRDKKAAHDSLVLSRLPKTIHCEKCDAPNPFSNDQCDYCGHLLNKSKYYTDEYYEQNEKTKLESDTSISSVDDTSYTFHYIISFLIPLVGFILGATMLASDNDEKSSCGKTCIIISIFSCISYTILLTIF